jgi:hypothetical protein
MFALALVLVAMGIANFATGRGAGIAAVLLSMGLALGVSAWLSRSAGCGMGVILPLSASAIMGLLVGLAFVLTSGVGALAKKAGG